MTEPSPWNIELTSPADLDRIAGSQKGLAKALYMRGHRVWVEYEIDKKLGPPQGRRPRRWRSDIFLPDLKIAIEVDGLEGHVRGEAGRHMRRAGRTADNYRDLCVFADYGVVTLRTTIAYSAWLELIAALDKVAAGRGIALKETRT